MVGNGLNDSVAMANASVGIAVCGASNPAQVSADICLLQNDLALIPKTLEISISAVNRMKSAFALFHLQLSRIKLGSCRSYGSPLASGSFNANF